ncbi:hypothetical protein D9M72_339250 [compost metagenome]
MVDQPGIARGLMRCGLLRAALRLQVRERPQPVGAAVRAGQVRGTGAQRETAAVAAHTAQLALRGATRHASATGTRRGTGGTGGKRIEATPGEVGRRDAEQRPGAFAGTHDHAVGIGEDKTVGGLRHACLQRGIVVFPGMDGLRLALPRGAALPCQRIGHAGQRQRGQRARGQHGIPLARAIRRFEGGTRGRAQRPRGATIVELALAAQQRGVAVIAMRGASRFRALWTGHGGRAFVQRQIQVRQCRRADPAHQVAQPQRHIDIAGHRLAPLRQRAGGHAAIVDRQEQQHAALALHRLGLAHQLQPARQPGLTAVARRFHRGTTGRLGQQVEAGGAGVAPGQRLHIEDGCVEAARAGGMDRVVGQAVGARGCDQRFDLPRCRQRCVADRLRAGRQFVELGRIEVVAPLRARSCRIARHQARHAAQQPFVLEHAFAQCAAGLAQLRIEMLLGQPLLESLHLAPRPRGQQRPACRDQQRQQGRGKRSQSHGLR